jgi:hypothetical protein
MASERNVLAISFAAQQRKRFSPEQAFDQSMTSCVTAPGVVIGTLLYPVRKGPRLPVYEGQVEAWMQILWNDRASEIAAALQNKQRLALGKSGRRRYFESVAIPWEGH